MKTRGFTFVETVLATLIIGIGLFGIMNLFQGTVGMAFTTDRAIQATHLARERVEVILFDKKMRGYDYVVSGAYPATENFAAPFDSFSRTVSIQEVRADDLVTPQPGTGYKRIVVTVNWGAGNGTTLETLVTEWNE